MTTKFGIKFEYKKTQEQPPDFSFRSTAQSMAFWAGLVNGGLNGGRKYMGDFPSKLRVSSRTFSCVIPLALKNFATSLVPGH